jgi:hypothetical protein
MPRQPEPWGGDVHLPRWLRRGRQREETGDTPERQHELHEDVGAPSKSIPDNAKDLLGSFSIMLPRDQRRSGRR